MSPEQALGDPDLDAPQRHLLARLRALRDDQRHDASHGGQPARHPSGHVGGTPTRPTSGKAAFPRGSGPRSRSPWPRTRRIASSPPGNSRGRWRTRMGGRPPSPAAVARLGRTALARCWAVRRSRPAAGPRGSQWGPPPDAGCQSRRGRAVRRAGARASTLWREGLMDMLSRNLNGAGPLRVVSPTIVMRNWSGRADVASARQVGLRTGAGLERRSAPSSRPERTRCGWRSPWWTSPHRSRWATSSSGAPSRGSTSRWIPSP